MTRLMFVFLMLLGLSSPHAAASPRLIADELLAADRAFSAASAKTDLITGLSAMFAADVAMPAPGGIAYGAAKATEALKSNAANAGAKAVWSPARVGLSGDGLHGFTAGFMTITRADGSINFAKYLAYWEKQSDGWRALAYKRVPAQLKARETDPVYVLPKEIVTSKADAAAIERNRHGLAEIERSFSRDAQTMGIGAAFTQYGSPDAINLFGGSETEPFTVGNVAIGQQVGQGQAPNTSSVNWGPEKTIIAASGDFGVTIGYIVPNKPAADGKVPPGQPFFTIWKRDLPNGKWLYIAE
jgi:ketosteroid isomerase-like protein